MNRLALISLLACVGCGAKEMPTDAVPVADVPVEVTKAAERAMPKAKLTGARRIQVNGEEVYQIRGQRPNGKLVEVDVAADGRIVDSRQ